MSTASLPGPANITRVPFANGLTVLARANHAAPVVSLAGSLPAGALHERPNQAGLASFTANLLTRGSQAYSYAAFNEIVEGVGGNLTFSSDTHSTDFAITCLSEDFPALVAVLADALRRPTFPADHVERVRQQRLVYLQERDQDTAAVASVHFYAALFGRTHPYGWPLTGYTETIAGITRRDIAAFHRTHYTPQGAAIAVAGDIEPDAAVALLQQHLGDWRGPAPQRTAPPFPAPQRGRQRHPVPGKVQADLVMGAPAMPRRHPDYYAARVANSILGQFGMMGRLGASVREDQGLAYHCGSSVIAEEAGGVWLATAGVDPEAVEQAIDSILAEFGRLAAEPPPAAELADSQAYLTGIIPLTLETNDGVANTLLLMEWYNLGLDYLLRYRDLIEAVTPADVQRVARTYLWPELCTVVVAEPQ